MAGRGLILCLFLAISAFGINAEGEVDILYSPASLKFSGHGRLLESSLKEIFSSSLGLSVEENSEWSGLSIRDPFNTPEAVVEVYVDGVGSLGIAADQKVVHYPLVVDEYKPDTYLSMHRRIAQHYADGANKVVNVKLAKAVETHMYNEVFGSMKNVKVSKQPLENLKPDSIDEDYQFLAELQALRTITEKISSGVITPDNNIDYYHFQFSSLHPLSDFHGADSKETIEAKQLLVEALEGLKSAFVKAYDGSVLVVAVTSDVSHTRRRVRAAEDEPQSEAENEDLNLAPDFSEDYPAMFNIMLWFSVIWFFATVAIVYAIMDMDPGRDSIIYRMTTMKIKKDN